MSKLSRSIAVTSIQLAIDNNPGSDPFINVYEYQILNLGKARSAKPYFSQQDRIKARTIRFVQHTVDFPVEKLSVVERSALTVKDMPSGNIDLREIRKQRIAIAVNSVYRRKAQRQIHGGHYGNERKSQNRIRRRVKRTSLIFITIGRKRGQAPSPETVLVGKLLSRRWSQSPFSSDDLAM